jgi:AcrR family transcriptional regulator
MNEGPMSTPGRTPSARPASRRRGIETRRRVEEMAAELFTSNGYSATRMQAIADAAGVHVQTIYLAYHTKAAVLAACAARLVAGDEDPTTHPSQRRWVREIQATADPRR